MANSTAYEDNLSFDVHVTVTDGDGSTGNTSFTATINDDSPIVSATVTDGDAITITTHDHATLNGGSETVTADFSGAFGTDPANTSYGADGPGSLTTAYAVTATLGDGTDSGLTSGGQHIYVFDYNGTVVGTTSAAGTTDTSAWVFQVSVDSAGTVSMTQFAALDHPAPGVDSNFDAQTIALPTDLISLTATSTITDGDGDKASSSATLDLGGNLLFADDGPHAVISVANLSVSLDESAGVQTDSNDVAGSLAVFDSVAQVGHDADTGGAPVGYALSTSSVLGNVVDSTGTTFGADGGSVAYSLSTTDGTDSGLKTTDGASILLYNEGGIIVGRVGSQAGDAAFAVAIDATTGAVSVVEYLSIQHNLDGLNPDDSVSITDSAISAVVTATDGDHDYSTASAHIGSLITFQDSAPVMTAASDINIQNSGDYAATGTFAYDLGADGARTDNNVFASVTGDATINGVAVQNYSITESSENASSAIYTFSFDYAVGNGTIDHETGTLTFDKVNGTYTVDLDHAIKAYVTVDTQGGSAFVGYQLNTSTIDTTQPAVAVTTLVAESSPGAHDGFYAQFTGIDSGNGSHETVSYSYIVPPINDGSASTWTAGELISEGTSLQNSWVSVSNASNGVGGDTIGGNEVLNFDLYNSNPTGVTGSLATASSDSMYLAFDGIGNSENLLIIVKLWEDTNHNGLIDAGDTFTTKAIAVDNGDIYRFDNSHWAATQTALAGSPYESLANAIHAGSGSNNDGLVIIESNDFNSGGSTWQIIGAEIVNSADGVTGTAIDLNRAVGSGGGSTGTEAFSNISDTSPLKVTNIGFNVPTTSAQNANLTFNATIQDGDNDPLTQTIHATVTSAVDSSTPIALSGSVTSVTPVVLDLNGDGLHFLGTSAGVAYNYGHGSVATAWAGPGDGILAVDLNGDGKVTSAEEFVFGGNTMTDLQGIAARYDSNHDGVLDAHDAAYAQFGVWQDANSNGVADPGEFHTLAELGITAISLTNDGNASTAAGGDVTIHGMGTFTWANGSTGTLADASFATALRSQQRTSEAVTTAAVAAGVLHPLEVAAATLPGDHAAQHLALADIAITAPRAMAIETLDSTALKAASKASSLLNDTNQHGNTQQPDHSSHLDTHAAQASIQGATSGSEHATIASGASASDMAAGMHDIAPTMVHMDGIQGAMMDAVLGLQGAQTGAAGGKAVHAAAVQEALADFAGNHAVEAIVDHYTAGGAGGAHVAAHSTNFAALHIGPEVLAAALDGHIFAGMASMGPGSLTPEMMDHHAAIAAAAHG
ncbi:DUF5801 repeats-in-toxin domain-containing protein [Tsuneonella mangrovi]|uniref:DUF5801 repeats-in-toxin domain-containing protein n=1 Tax=Tsuneonella mangrovi TaxID=1982042 RepID=UPI000BA24B92|nr:DUF5801 repeats-in-toxin domain-containing protein [Tsuneonella mangrovi]